MKDLFKGIYAEFTGSIGEDSLYVALTGGLHNTVAPQDAERPYAVFFLISDVPFWTFDSTFESVLVQFNIYDENSSVGNVCSLFEKLKTLYDDAVLTFDDYYNYQMKREFSDLMKFSEIWQYAIQYRIGMEAK